MEQYRVKKRFTDRESGETHEQGEIISVSAERAAELQEAGHLPAKPLKDKEPEATSEPAPEV